MRMLCSEAQVDSTRVRGGFMSKDDWQRLTNAATLLSEAPIYIDDSPDISALEVRAKARRLKMEKKIELIIIDYLQLIEPDNPDFLYAAADHYLKRGRLGEAKRMAERMIGKHPSNRLGHDLLGFIESRMRE